MGATKLGNQKDEEEAFFCDAWDEFPFFDCGEAFSQGSDSSDDVASSANEIVLDSEPYPGNLSRSNLRRRRQPSSGDSKDSKSSVSSERNGHLDSKVEKCEYLIVANGVKDEFEHVSQKYEIPEESKLDMRFKSKHIQDDDAQSFKVDKDEIGDNKESSAITDATFKRKDDAEEVTVALEEESVVIGANRERIRDFVDDDTRKKENSGLLDASFRRTGDYVEDSIKSGENHDASASFLVLLAGLLIKAIGFQFNVFISLFKWPLWLIYSSFMVVIDPFRVLRRCKRCLKRRIMGILGYARGHISAFLCDFLEEHKSLLKMSLKLGWGILWSVYVCVVLVCLLVAAFVIGGILSKVLVENPVRMTESLNFDYTETSPVAFVSLAEFSGANCGLGSTGKANSVNLVGVNGLPPEHKFKVTVSMTLPESDYNRNLGIFQVRVDFLGPDGKVLASSRRPCMLRFSSEPIRLLLTFFKMAPLLTGYSSESQDLNIKFKGFTQTGIPITCLRVTIEQRAQFKPGAGIPEIYSASLLLESEQPFLKRILWYWSKTMFVWISMTIFSMELLMTLTCCKSIILPKVKLGRSSAATNDSQ